MNASLELREIQRQFLNDVLLASKRRTTTDDTAYNAEQVALLNQYVDKLNDFSKRHPELTVYLQI